MEATQMMWDEDEDVLSEPTAGQPDEQAGTLVIKQEGTGAELEYPLYFGATIIGRSSGDPAEEETRVTKWQQEEAEKESGSESAAAAVHGLFLPGGSLSKQHARLDLNASGELWFLTDLKSSNGTFLTRTAHAIRCDPGVKHGMASGDSVRFGSVEATVLLKLVSDPGSLERETSTIPEEHKLTEKGDAEEVAAAALVEPTLPCEEEEVGGTDDGGLGGGEREGQAVQPRGDEEMLNAATLPPLFRHSSEDYEQDEAVVLEAAAVPAPADAEDGEEGGEAGGVRREEGPAADAAAAAAEEEEEEVGAAGGEESDATQPPEEGMEAEEPGAAAEDAGDQGAETPSGTPVGCAALPGSGPPDAPGGGGSGWRSKGDHGSGAHQQAPGASGRVSPADPSQDLLDPELAATAAALREKVLQDAKERLRMGKPSGADLSPFAAPGGSPRSSSHQAAPGGSTTTPTAPAIEGGSWKVRGRKSSTGAAIATGVASQEAGGDDPGGASLPSSDAAAEGTHAAAVAASGEEGEQAAAEKKDLEGGQEAAAEEAMGGDEKRQEEAPRPAESGRSSDVTVPPEECAAVEAGDEAGSGAADVELGAEDREGMAPELPDSDEAPLPETAVEDEDAAMLYAQTLPFEEEEDAGVGGVDAEDAALLNAATLPFEEEEVDAWVEKLPVENAVETLPVENVVETLPVENVGVGGVDVEEAALGNAATLPVEEEEVVAGVEKLPGGDALEPSLEERAAEQESGGVGGVAVEVEMEPGAKGEGGEEVLQQVDVAEEAEDEEMAEAGGEEERAAALETAGKQGSESVLQPEEEQMAEAVQVDKEEEAGRAEGGGSKGEEEEEVQKTPPREQMPPGEETQEAASALKHFVSGGWSHGGGASQEHGSPALTPAPTPTPVEEQESPAPASGAREVPGEETQCAAEALISGRLSAEQEVEAAAPVGGGRRGRGRAKARGRGSGRGRGRGREEEAEREAPAAPSESTRPARASSRKRSRDASGTPTPLEESLQEETPAKKGGAAAKRSRRSTAGTASNRLSPGEGSRRATSTSCGSPDVMAADTPRASGDAVGAQEVRVAFSTCIGAALLKTHTQAIEALGGAVCSGQIQDAFTHLVTMEGKPKDGKGFIRSFKTLLALAAGRPIVDHRWVTASRKAGRFLPPDPAFLLRDPDAERTYGFSIAGAFRNAASGRLALEGFQVFFSPAFLKAEKDGGRDIRKLVEAAGGQPAASLPKALAKAAAGGKRGRGGASSQGGGDSSIVVALEADRAWAGRTLRAGVPVRGRDHLLRLLMRQEVPCDTPGPKESLFTTP